MKKISFVSSTLSFLLVLIVGVTIEFGTPAFVTISLPAADDNPVYSSYRGVELGMAIEDARKKLGSPKERSDGQDYYEFSDNESAQLYYDAAKKVTAITATYIGKLDSAPTAKAIFGQEAEVKPDGGIFKMVRYPKAGFWISYTKTGGDDPLIMIAMQKI